MSGVKRSQIVTAQRLTFSFNFTFLFILCHPLLLVNVGKMSLIGKRTTGRPEVQTSDPERERAPTKHFLDILSRTREAGRKLL